MGVVSIYYMVKLVSSRLSTALPTLMERLSKDHEEVEWVFAYVSTNPVTAERIERARAAAQQ